MENKKYEIKTVEIKNGELTINGTRVLGIEVLESRAENFCDDVHVEILFKIKNSKISIA